MLRRIRRRSLASLRREVEPVDRDALARFLPAWQGVGGSLRGVDRTLEVIEQLQGAPLVAGTLERDVLAARIRDYTPAWLDELAAAGDVVWVGRGALGARDGRIGLYLRDRAHLLAPLPPEQGPDGAAPGGDAPRVLGTEVHARLHGHLLAAGASFWPQLYAAAGGGNPEEVIAALWDLVWAGLVTNDSFTALRAVTGEDGRSVGRRAGSRRGRRPGRVASRTGPPAAAGRWSLVSALVEPPASPTERAAALAAQLLDRHGVVVRDGVTAEEVPGGFSAVYPVLKAMEESGRARRGYFVEGLGGAQFAVPGAVDRLRSVRRSRALGATGPERVSGGPDTADLDAVVVAATDPANPYGAALPWPDAEGRGGPRRVGGARVVLVEGHLAVYLEKGGRSVLTFGTDEEMLELGAQALAGIVATGRVRSLQIERIDGEEALAQPLVPHLRAAGFTDGPKGLVRRS